MIKRVWKWLQNLLVLIFVFIILVAGFSMIQAKKNPDQIPSILGYKPFAVLSGSMRPLLEPGDLLVAKNVNPFNISVGDVVTYRLESKTIVTHRVVEIIERDGSLLFRTRGDANNTDDQNLISAEQLIGTMAFKIPYGGYITRFVRSPRGFMLFIIIPVLILLSGELKFLIAELSKEEKTVEEVNAGASNKRGEVVNAESEKKDRLSG